MTITITIDAESGADLRSQLLDLLGGSQRQLAAVAATIPQAASALPPEEKAFSAPGHPIPAAQADVKRTRGKKGIAPVTDPSAPIDASVPVPGEQADEGNASASTADAAETTPEASAPAAGEGKPAETMDYADVGNALLQLTRLKGREATLALLSEFGVDNARNLDKDKWPLLVARAKAMIG